MKPTIEVTISPRLLAYLESLVEAQGFGESVEQVALGFIWNGVNEQIVANRFSFVPPELNPKRQSRRDSTP